MFGLEAKETDNTNQHLLGIGWAALTDLTDEYINTWVGTKVYQSGEEIAEKTLKLLEETRVGISIPGI